MSDDLTPLRKLAEAATPGPWSNADDATDYPDCRDAFIRAVSELTEMSASVSVVAPLIGKRKAEVMALASTLNIDLADTWSCYEPRRGQPCGTCNACRLRG